MAEETTTQVVQDLWGGNIEVPAPTETATEVVETQVTETPVATEEVPTEAPVETKEEVKAEPIVQEKIVEKIIEKYPEFKDEYSKSLFEKLVEGGEEGEKELFNYLSEKNKNYEVMSDLDVVRERIRKDNPQWTNKDVDSEIRFKYGKEFNKVDLSEIDEDDRDAYEKALKHNDEVERRELVLERDARDARYSLESAKKNIELPKIQREEETPQANQQLTPEQVDELNREWERQVEQSIPQLDDIKFKVGNEEVAYKITDDEKRELVGTMKDFEAVTYLKSRGWFDENGNPDILRITEDVYRLENTGKILSASASKIKTETTKEVVAEIKNVDLSKSTQTPDVTVDAGALIWR